jgi:hypothetical protein
MQLIAGALLAIWAGSYWFEHRYSLPLLICGLLIHRYGLMFITFAARTLHLIHRVDFAAPVLDIQKQLAALRLWNIRSGQWFGAVGCFIWIPIVLILWGHGTGAHPWSGTPRFLYWLIATGSICLALLLGLVLLPRWAPKAARHLEGSYIGRSVRRVQARLDEIARFERE